MLERPLTAQLCPTFGRLAFQGRSVVPQKGDRVADKRELNDLDLTFRCLAKKRLRFYGALQVDVRSGHMYVADG